MEAVPLTVFYLTPSGKLALSQSAPLEEVEKGEEAVGGGQPCEN